MDTENLNIHEIKKEKFINKIYNNKFALTTIVIISTIVLMITVAFLITAFTVWK